MQEHREFRADYTANEFALRRALLDLAAFLDEERVAPAHVARVSSAAGELLANVLRHAYADGASGGTFAVRAEVRSRIVRLTIQDHGVGFDVDEARLESVPAALPRRGATANDEDRGLVRVARLCESLELSSDAQGATIELAFELTLAPIDCASDDLGLTNADDFHPHRLRPLVASLRRSEEEWERVPSALTLTLNRLLGEARASRETVAARPPLG